MNTGCRMTVCLTAALIATCVLVQVSYAAPPSASLGILKNNGLIAPRTTTKKKFNSSTAIVTDLKPLPAIGGALPILPGAGALEMNPLPGGGGNGGGNAGGNGGGNPGGNGGGNGGGKPPKPDWVGIVGGIGSILNSGPGHHPGHHPGYHPGHNPGYVPGYPNSGSSYVPSNPLPTLPVDPSLAVVVANPEKNGASISFVAGGRQYTLAPGYQQTIAQGTSVEVRFDRGGLLGTARYTLENGTFQFLVTAGGWDLFRKVHRVVLDNRENPFSFKYIVGNTIHEVGASSIRRYEENAPLVVRFDPGTGQATTRTLDSGTYRISVNAEQRVWDLERVDVEAAVPGVAANLPPSIPTTTGM